MDEVHEIISVLRRRIDGIVARQVRMSGMLSSAEAEHSRLVSEKSSLEQENAGLKERIKALELSKGLEYVSGGEKGARERVNKLLREVDKCIALMNK